MMFSVKVTLLDKTTHSNPYQLMAVFCICWARQNCLMAINFLVSLLKKNWNNVSRLSRKDLKILKTSCPLSCIWLVTHYSWPFVGLLPQLGQDKMIKLLVLQHASKISKDTADLNSRSSDCTSRARWESPLPSMAESVEGNIVHIGLVLGRRRKGLRGFVLQ